MIILSVIIHEILQWSHPLLPQIGDLVYYDNNVPVIISGKYRPMKLWKYGWCSYEVPIRCLYYKDIQEVPEDDYKLGIINVTLMQFNYDFITEPKYITIIKNPRDRYVVRSEIIFNEQATDYNWNYTEKRRLMASSPLRASPITLMPLASSNRRKIPVRTRS